MSSSEPTANARTGAIATTRAERIRAARRGAGLTQRELAERVGTSLWTMDQIESGGRAPQTYAERIEAALGRPEGWLDASDLTPSHTAATRAQSGQRLDRFGRDLVIAVFAIIVTVRFFTEQVGLLPAAGNFIDVALLPVLALAAGIRPSRSGAAPAVMSRTAGFALPAALFLIVCVVSAALNSSRVAPAPALLFVYGFLGPLAFFYATHALWPGGNTISMSRLLAWLGALQFAVILIFDVPQFLATGNPDDIAGTFGGNAYQLVFFLLVFAAFVSGVATFEPKRQIARFAPVLLGLTFLVVFLAQYRALLVSTALVIILVGILLGSSRPRGFLVGALAMAALIAGLWYVAAEYPSLKFAPTIDAVRDDPTSFVTARLAPGSDVIALYGDDVRFIGTGSGPGTFSSRAWRTFSDFGDPANPTEGAAQPYVIALTGGNAYHTDVSDKYLEPRLTRAATTVLGSGAVNSPFSSYLALLAEVGVIGFALMIVLYIRGGLLAIRLSLDSMRQARTGDPLPALALATAVAFFLLVQMAFLENWLEVARVTVPSWMLLAICVKEIEWRDADRTTGG